MSESTFAGKVIRFFELDTLKGWAVFLSFLAALLGSFGFNIHQVREIEKLASKLEKAEHADCGVCLPVGHDRMCLQRADRPGAGHD